MKRTIVKAMTVTAMTAAAVSLGTEAAGAAPANPVGPPASVELAPSIRYAGDGATAAAANATPFGVVEAVGGQVSVADAERQTVFGNPDAVAPQPSAGGKVDTARPDTINADTPKSAADKNADIQTALGTVATSFGLAAGTGAMAGGVGGAVIGCAVPGLVGIAVTAGVLSIPACLAGAATLGGLGAIVGGAVVGAPVGIATGIQQYQQLQANGDL